MIIRRKTHGFTLIEVLIVVAISGMLMVSLSNVVGGALTVSEVSKSQNDLNREAGYILDHIVQIISRSPEVNTGFPGIVFTAKVDPERDSDMDNYPDVDNDKDGEVDEGPVDQDWGDLIIYRFFSDTQRLIEEDPFPADVNEDGFHSDADRRAYTVSENVTSITGTLLPKNATRSFDLLTVNLELTGGNGDAISRSVTIRVGGAL